MCLFDAATDRFTMDGAWALRSPTARQILSHVVAQPGASGRNVATATGLDPATVTYHVQRLQRAGLVEARRRGRQLAIFASGSAPFGMQGARAGVIGHPSMATGP